jgi:hypothetical protein
MNLYYLNPETRAANCTARSQADTRRVTEQLAVWLLLDSPWKGQVL